MSKFGSFGVASTRQWIKPSRLKAIIIGDYNSGKTTFLASNPAALIVNVDLSSTPVPSPDSPPPPAQIWPAMSPDGFAMHPDGTPVKGFGFAPIRKLADQLVEAAQKNLPRPEMVVFDSITELFNMLRRYTLEHFEKETWDEGRGDAMWEWLYQQLNTLFTDLREVGYGVWVVAHISPETITDGDGKKSVRWSLSTPPGFFKRFYGTFELALEMQKGVQVSVKEVERKVKVGDGYTIMKDTETVKESSFTLIGENPTRISLYKRRVCFPERLNVPAIGGWAIFEEAYLKAAKPVT